MPDTSIKPPAGPEEDPARDTGRRWVRWLAILTFGIVAVLAIWQQPLYAWAAA